MKNIYLMPDKESLKSDFLLKYKYQFLSLNDLKIGDAVVMEFDYEKIHTNYNRKGESKFNWKQKCEGILKEDENGFLYAESKEKLPFYHLESKGRKDYYVRELKHSIIRFGEGYLFF